MISAIVVLLKTSTAKHRSADQTCGTISSLGIIAPPRDLLCVLLLAFFLCGCAQVDYTAYSGRQQNWPVANGSFVQRKFDLPVYLGPPDRPYRVLGYMEVESAPLAVWETGKNESIKLAVKEAAKHGADAVVLLASWPNISGSTTFSSGQWGSNTTTTGGVYGNFQCSEPDDRRRFRLNHDTANPERIRSRNRHSIFVKH